MNGGKLLVPDHYRPTLDVRETQAAIKILRDSFQNRLAQALNLQRISAPLFVPAESGLNDNLNGIERPVQFDIPDTGDTVQIVQSLAKWKRMALGDYGFAPGEGMYTDMNAIRRDETLDNLHSVYVDQWDWESVITHQDRNLETLKRTVAAIYDVIKGTSADISAQYPTVKMQLAEEITFVTTQELEDLYPELTPKEREDAITRKHGAVFLIGIGHRLNSGEKHDGRAPDYDDWSLNGDILVWSDILERAFELSSMGIRVDEEAMERQLTLADCQDRAGLPFHSALLAGKLPYTMGGGIGQSRMCMYLLQKAHIGEVQASTWPVDMIETCRQAGIFLL